LARLRTVSHCRASFVWTTRLIHYTAHDGVPDSRQESTQGIVWRRIARLAPMIWRGALGGTVTTWPAERPIVTARAAKAISQATTFARDIADRVKPCLRGKVKGFYPGALWASKAPGLYVLAL
jgi:hypothetical protein